MARFYVSSHDVDDARDAADILRAAGHEVVSTWHDQDAPPLSGTRSMRNFPQIRSCDVLVLIASDDPVPGGKLVEAGFALGCGKRVLTVGGIENAMLLGPGCAHLDGMSDLATYAR